MLDPETRNSLLIRVRDPADRAAWEEFVDIYAPVIFRVAKRKGLQDADAEDIVQQVFMSISQALEKRPHDKTRARFRTWLERVAENAALNALTRGKPDRGAGDTAMCELLNQQPSPKTAAESRMLRQEYQQEVFRWAARRIESEFAAETWRAFWATSVEQQPCEQVAQQLGKSVGSVYAARSRIMRRLQEKVSEYEN